MKRRASNLESLLLENILFSHYITYLLCSKIEAIQGREREGGWREETREKTGEEGRDKRRDPSTISMFKDNHF